jgi:glycosyltransferase Alg8
MSNTGLEVLLIALGPIAVWRYSWWMLHVLRAVFYAWCAFPPLRKRADQLWRSGWRPPVVHFVLTTFKEKPEVTRAVLASVFDECRGCAAPANIIIGTGDASDEKVIEAFCAEVDHVPAKVTLVWQNQPGKRIAIGLALRALSRHGVASEDIVVFMDGDSILCPGVIQKCAPLFALRPKLGAVTTNEAVIVNGPRWMQTWLDLRFAQRRIAMQSHSLSNKVLTLTGRLSIYRAPLVVEEPFIRMVEADFLDHWLWGRFRFLSGDDKSTWYALLRDGFEMLYVPDAAAVTVENVESRPWERRRSAPQCSRP